MRQPDLPLKSLRPLRLVARAASKIIYFGKRQQFVCIGTMVRRVGA